jgi:lipoate-protein ligase A
MPWRLLESGYADGPTNMAVDEAILWAVAAHVAPPTLRLYGWRPAAVSLGYFQEVEGQVDRAEIARRGWGLVRRPTGGRAILHDHEVTYSVVLPAADLERGDSVMASYREISRGLELGLQALGLAAALGETLSDPAHRDSARDLPAVCFAQAGRGDLVAEGRKVVGSAQVRREGVILQHGSVPIALNLEDQVAVMPGPRERPESRERLARAAQGLGDLLGQPLSFERLRQALIQGFAEAFALSLEPAPLSPAEQEKVEELLATKYATDAWNLRAPGRPRNADPAR